MSRADGPGPCRICGAPAEPALQTDGRRFDRCPACGTLQARLDEAGYAAIHRTYDPGAYLDGKDAAEVAAHLDVDAKVSFLRRVAPQEVARGGRLLDIGCGMGGYLLAGRALGFEVLGFEPSAEHGRVARDVLKLPVIDDYFTAAKAGGDRFDLVLLSHVIEHIYRPPAFLAEVLSVVAPGGTLVMVTPNAESVTARWFGAAWPMLRPEDHVTLIGPRGVAPLLAAAGGGAEAHASTSEYSYEFAATLASLLRARLARSPVAGGAAEAPPAMERTGAAARWRNRILALASLPFHLAAKALDRQSCLTVVFRRHAEP